MTKTTKDDLIEEILIADLVRHGEDVDLVKRFYDHLMKDGRKTVNRWLQSIEYAGYEVRKP